MVRLVNICKKKIYIVKIVKIVEKCQKLSKNVKNCQKLSPLLKIVNIVENCQKLSKFSKIRIFSKILTFSENPKIFKKYEKFF